MSISQDTSSICSQPHRKSVGEAPADSLKKFHFKDFNRLYKEAQERRAKAGKYLEPEMWPKNRKQHKTYAQTS